MNLAFFKKFLILIVCIGMAELFGMPPMCHYYGKYVDCWDKQP